MIESLSVNEYVDFLVRNQITPRQFLLCFVHYYDELQEKKGGKRVLATLYKYVNGFEKFDTKSTGVFPKISIEDLTYLVDKGFLVNIYGEEVKDVDYPDNYRVTDKFIDEIFVVEDEFDEFFNAYPVSIPNFENPHTLPRIPLRSCDREKLEQLYKRYVVTKKKHKQVLEIVRWAKEHNKIVTNITNFVNGALWEGLEQEYGASGGNEEFGLVL